MIAASKRTPSRTRSPNPEPACRKIDSYFPRVNQQSDQKNHNAPDISPNSKSPRESLQTQPPEIPASKVSTTSPKPDTEPSREELCRSNGERESTSSSIRKRLRISGLGDRFCAGLGVEGNSGGSKRRLGALGSMMRKPDAKRIKGLGGNKFSQRDLGVEGMPFLPSLLDVSKDVNAMGHVDSVKNRAGLARNVRNQNQNQNQNHGRIQIQNSDGRNRSAKRAAILRRLFPDQVYTPSLERRKVGKIVESDGGTTKPGSSSTEPASCPKTKTKSRHKQGSTSGIGQRGAGQSVTGTVAGVDGEAGARASPSCNTNTQNSSKKSGGKCVRFAHGPYSDKYGSGDGHSVEEARQTCPRTKTPTGKQFTLSRLTRTGVREAEKLLGKSYMPSILRLKRRVGMLPCYQRETFISGGKVYGLDEQE